MKKDNQIEIEKYKSIANKKGYKVILVGDENFPIIDDIRQNELPQIFSYKGDISLLNNIENNIAVVGVLTPDNDIVERERKIIEALAQRGKIIVSGLAKGCDTVAHECAIKYGTKTVAFLPSTLDKIYPKENIELAERIIDTGGLIATEYILEAESRYDAIKRFVDRDRLQAMFSKASILIASFRKGDGDSGSRHCIQKAKAYGRKVFVMYNQATDVDRSIFGLNADIISKGYKILTTGGINEL